MFDSVGRMFRSSQSNEENKSSPKKVKLKEPDRSTYSLNIDDSSIILRHIQQLHVDNLMTDVVLVIDRKEYPAHRLILCASSDVFQVMLMRPEWAECHTNQVILQETQQCCSVFRIFLDYFYSGRITLNYDNVMPLLTLADKYNVKNLIDTCVAYMCSNVAYAASQNELISWLQYTLACGHNEVFENCLNFVKWNFDYVASTKDYGNFDIKVFANLLQQNDLVVENEMSLYNCAVKWLELQKERLCQECVSEAEAADQMEAFTEQVMCHVRFPMMTPRQLAELLLSPLVKRYKEFFVERMAVGMSYHSGQTDRIDELCTSEEGKLLFTPRLYTADHLGSDLKIDNFTSMPNFTSRTFLFYSQTALAEHRGNSDCEWAVDVYAKGVWFKKFHLLVWQGTIEVPEYILPTIRVAVTCKHASAMHVKIGLLVYGMRAGVEHVLNVAERIHTFTPAEPLYNIDDLIPFSDLNPPASMENLTENHITGCYLIGSERNVLKMHIIITPLTNICSKISPNLRL